MLHHLLTLINATLTKQYLSIFTSSITAIHLAIALLPQSPQHFTRSLQLIFLQAIFTSTQRRATFPCRGQILAILHLAVVFILALSA